MANRLASATSPYLLQHAGNPVDWWEWSPEAFEEAKRRDVPVLLSIGYSACHWCHVMAHESFEDPEIAAIMNEGFVSIKVDREEHPDVDAVYMEAVQAMAGRAGWPLTVFLTPDGLPFYGGTYFPPHEGSGVPSFRRLLTEVSRVFSESRDEVEEQGITLQRAIAARTSVPASAQEAPPAAREAAEALATAILAAHDPEWGGTGRAPKFLQPHLWMAALDLHLLGGDSRLEEALATTLDAAAAGGIYDHLAGGFARYSTDAFWMVPHFEKMLYDQALNARLYLRAYVATGNPDYRQVAVETLDFTISDLREPGGLFAASLDADSEGEEGSYYIFRREEIEEVLGDRAEEFIAHYGVTKAGNFEGRNILHRTKRGEMARSESLEQSRLELLAYRRRRVAPALDDKAVVEWNAMFVATLAEAGFRLGRQDYLELAESGFDLLHERAAFGSGPKRLAAKKSPPAVLADHAQMVGAAISLAQFSGKPRFLEAAVRLWDQMLEGFDRTGGAFVSTARRSPGLIAKVPDIFDTAYPSANSTLARAAFDLSVLTGDPTHFEVAEELLLGLGENLSAHAIAFPSLAGLIAVAGTGSAELVLPGRNEELLEVARRTYLPNLFLLWGEPFPGPLFEGRLPGKAYLCRDYACLAPASSAAELSAQIESVAAEMRG
ncbi:MAG: thioredoxin domain-containing protein [Actinomycetota bacterium]|nr:thioredoxin domain-containing protein [Actinomycetota bacterium]